MKNEIMTFKINESEKMKIVKTAKMKGMKTSEFIRSAALDACRLCKQQDTPEEQEIQDIYEYLDEKIEIRLTLDKKAVDKLDAEAKELGTSRSLMARRMILEKKVITCSISLDLSELFNQLIDAMTVLNIDNKNILQTIERAGSFFTEHDREIVRNNSNKVAEAIANMQKQVWRSNIVVKDVAKKEVRKYLQENGG